MTTVLDATVLDVCKNNVSSFCRGALKEILNNFPFNLI